MSTLSGEKVYLPYSVYKNIVDHLSVHAPSDDWAKSCLDQLLSADVDEEVVPVLDPEALIV